jgi:hypothetical protein
MIEQKTDMDKLEEFCIERLNHRNPKVCAGEAEVEYGEFLRRNNPVKFKEELDSFVAKLKEIGVLGLTPATDSKNQYYFTANMDAHLSILKYVD